MMRYYSALSVAIFAILGAALLPNSTLAIGNNQALWGDGVKGGTIASRESQGEFFYWDGDTLYGAGGKFDGIVEFKQDGGRYIPTAPVKVVPGDVYGGSAQLPCDDNTLRRDNLEVRLEGSNLREDIIGDGSGGLTMGSGHIKWEITKTLPPPANNPTSKGQTIMSECNYDWFSNFRYIINEYNGGRLTQNGVSGQLLGKKGIKFDEWVKRSDRMNVFIAMRDSAATNIVERCNRDNDKMGCTFFLRMAYDRCSQEAVKQPGKFISEFTPLSDPAWNVDFDSQKLSECLKKDKSIEKYLPPSDVDDFVKEIIDEADIPPSVKPVVPDATPKSADGKDPASTTCSIYRVGWIMCPAFSFIAKMNDALFGILKNWLVIAPFKSKVGSTNSAAYQAWSDLRNVANVLFAIFFVFMIFSLMTSYGNQSYGLRKAIPKLIIVALLVNASFIICSVANDLANIAGDSIFKILKDMPVKATTNSIGGFERATSGVILSGGAAALTVGVLVNLSALIPILIGAMFAFVMTIFILTVRQVVVIMLVVISPIAFAMLLLPNTKKWFDKWRSILVAMLLIYPTIALIFGGAYFASEAVAGSAAGNGQTLLNIMSLGILVLPLFISPLLLKLGGGLMNRFGGIINNPQKGLKDRAVNAAKQFRQDRKLIKGTRGMQGKVGLYSLGARMSARREFKRNFRSSEEARAQNRRQGRGKDKYMTMFTAGGLANRGIRDSVETQIASALDKAGREDMHVRSILIDDQETPLRLDAAVSSVLAGNSPMPGGGATDQAERLAVFKKAFDAKDVGEVNKIMAHVNNMTDFERKVVSELMTSSGIQSSAPHLDQTAATKVARNEYQSAGNPLHQMYTESMANGNFTPDAAAHASPSTIAGLGDARKAGALTDADINQFKSSFQVAEGNHELSKDILGRSRSEVGKL